ncbi:MAG: DUF3379 family protein [Woeseiaceae bacterium]|nr:DUF3379 family protein [Woeseiaceae bacterium]
MNCEEYRQATGADPHFEDETGHAAGCPECRAFRDEMIALDARIGRALAIDVPPVKVPALPDVDADAVVDLGARRRLTGPAWFALAASVVLAAVLGFRMLGTGIQYDSLADEVLAHIDHEPWAMRVTDEPVAAARLDAVAGPVAEIGAGAPLVTYAQTCVINGKKVPHLVMQGTEGPVMILLLHDEKVDAAIPLGDESLHGVILPVANGSIAIVGARNEPIEALETAIVNSVTWQI